MYGRLIARMCMVKFVISLKGVFYRSSFYKSESEPDKGEHDKVKRLAKFAKNGI